VRDGIDGLLVDPDQPEEIAAALLRLLTEDDLASRLGRAGRERVRTTFSLPALLAKNEAFYQQCLDTFGART
jgi:glycosyltransferase involved in cell wall biosynthesis